MLFNDVAAFTRSAFAPRVVIVGSGPAGLTLALKLAERKVPCLVVEAGGFEHSEASQDFFRGTVVGDAYFELHEARLRQFGGSSGHWTGWCRALDATDFEPQPHIPNSGWPIRKSDLDPYVAAANELLKVGPFAADRGLTPELDEIEIAFSPPVRLALTHRQVVEASPAIGLLLHTAVRSLVPGDGGRIASITVAGADAREHELRVPTLVLACGGIENSRLLLWSNACHGGRVVPRAETLGRYWMEHPNSVVGDVLLFNGALARLRPRAFFAPTPTAKRARAIGGAHLWLRLGERNGAPNDKTDLKDLLRDALCVAPDLFAPLVQMAGKELLCGAPVHIEWEQVPQFENRIELSRDADANGVPRVRLHWRKSELERKTARITTHLLGEALIRNQLGRLRMRQWLANGQAYPNSSVPGGWHHLGGTRMAESPATGIVDRNCKVFGIANLYIGGSSVFSTGGHANPTYTIVQLAMRLGDHLAGIA